MGTYIVRRSLQALPLLLGVAILSFVLIQYLPGGPLTLMAHNPHMTPAQLSQHRPQPGPRPARLHAVLPLARRHPARRLGHLLRR